VNAGFYLVEPLDSLFGVTDWPVFNRWGTRPVCWNGRF